jgi:branched-chain amino acid transport system permease protein
MSLASGTFNQSYAQDMAILRTRTQRVILLAFLAFLFTGPLFINETWLTIMTIIGISVISVHGLNILTGYCGQISMGHSAFMAVGGYTSAILCAKLGFSFWAAMPLAALFAGLVGLIFGLPSLRVKGFYLIMATIAAYFIISWLVHFQLTGLTGGVFGLAAPKPEIFGMVLQSRASYFYLVMIIACLATVAAINIVRSRVGRAFIAIRDNDLAAEVMGINIWAYKLLAFFIGCVFAGLAGALLAHYYAWASIEAFPFMDSVWYLGMLIIGGMGSTTGAILGAVSFRLLDYLVIILAPMIAETFPAIAPQASASLSLIMRGLVIIVFLIFEPRGLAHGWGLIKAYFRLWPFSH